MQGLSFISYQLHILQPQERQAFNHWAVLGWWNRIGNDLVCTHRRKYVYESQHTQTVGPVGFTGEYCN